ncbi:hypothetical protein M976_04140 [Buttiauxella ferragutiae ATCC 51602]|uniref:Uncharacterized protein n=1 Tax=Buttiauxella ferragutiae ATCC 51602 TaxID=1354252 RepID=A0ABX2W2V0_9ENTR|nr:hypothetical protein M976_04140 [Buttiauxella ferragutiae ATCC 51602]
MMRYIILATRVVWFGLSMLILYFSSYRLSQLDSMRDISEIISIMSYVMILISFPTGVMFSIVLFFFGFILSTMHFDIENKYITIFLIWFFFFMGGYIQWVILIDRIVKKSMLLTK